MQIIRNREIIEDDFVRVDDAAELPAAGKPLVSLKRYAAATDELLGRYAALGVLVPPDKLPSDIPQLGRLALIALEFPRFTEGRGFSIARQLRQRHGFTGELRAVGWVVRDNLLYMERCGFNAFQLREGKPLASALQAFGELSGAYQTAVDEPLPIYRRR